MEGTGLRWRSWEDESARIIIQMSDTEEMSQMELILQKYSLDIQISNSFTNV